MAGFYRDADVFLFTSVWPEPFGRTVVEAMASQVVVVGTRTGGAAEILADGRNALTFEPGDANALAARVMRVTRDPVLRRELARRGRQEALEHFDIKRMTLEIEDFLRCMVDAA
jgi:glycosyltransferase involved in cell wall biosynthesis